MKTQNISFNQIKLLKQENKFVEQNVNINYFQVVEINNSKDMRKLKTALLRIPAIDQIFLQNRFNKLLTHLNVQEI